MTFVHNSIYPQDGDEITAISGSKFYGFEECKRLIRDSPSALSLTVRRKKLTPASNNQPVIASAAQAGSVAVDRQSISVLSSPKLSALTSFRG